MRDTSPTSETTANRPAGYRFTARPGEESAGTLELHGRWPKEKPSPPLAVLEQALADSPHLKRIIVDTANVEDSQGSGLVAFLLRCRQRCEQAGVELDTTHMPAGLERLLQLALAPPSREGDRTETPDFHPVERVGLTALAWQETAREAVAFVGKCAVSLASGLRGRAFFRKADLVLLLQQCGADALPIVALIAFLVGLILAFVGAIQLERFGASIYVADLVAIAMTREMGCVMVAIVLCGRTGAAYAAQLGTMKVNQEIDAFEVFGISSVDFLVLPRLIALVLMIPLLTLYANLVGILGGFAVARIMLGLSLIEYWNATMNALTLAHLSSGILKSLVFGLIIAFTGCLRGLQCGTNAAAVGAATTSAVVIAITGVVAADALFAVVFNVLGF